MLAHRYLKFVRALRFVSFVNHLISQRIESANQLLSKNFYTPARLLRGRNLFSVNNHRTHYAEFDH